MEEEQFRIIHEATLAILNNIGVFVKHEKAPEILEGGGCKVDHETQKVYVREDVLKRLLESTPREIRLYSRKAENNLPLNGSRMYVISGVAALSVVDLQGNRRKLAMQDSYDFIHLHDALESVNRI